MTAAFAVFFRFPTRMKRGREVNKESHSLTVNSLTTKGPQRSMNGNLSLGKALAHNNLLCFIASRATQALCALWFCVRMVIGSSLSILDYNLLIAFVAASAAAFLAALLAALFTALEVAVLDAVPATALAVL